MSADAKSLREAFLDGCAYERVHSPRSAEAVAEAKVRYPITVVRPRVVTDSHGRQWSFGHPNASMSGDTTLLMVKIDSGWYNDNHPSYPSITREIAADLAPLFANPTEEIAE